MDSCIAKLTYFLGVKFLPFFQVKLLVELTYEFCVDEIDEGITHIALVLRIGEVITL